MKSVLFVPGDRPERFVKALEAGASQVVIDLEDSVSLTNKQVAREHIAAFAQQNPQVSFMVRINAASTPFFNDDLILCTQLPNLYGVMLPKAESAEQINTLAQKISHIYPIIESALGVSQMAELARAQHVQCLSFGYLDLALDLGLDWQSQGGQQLLNVIRAQLIIQSKLAALKAPLDGVFPNFQDTDALAHIAQLAKGMGFAGMLCIHPKQVAVINQTFSYSAEQISWAQRVLAMAQETGSLAFQLEGKMVDKPVIDLAQKILAQ